MARKKPNIPGGKGFHRLPGDKDEKYMDGYTRIFGEKKFHGRDSKDKSKAD